MSFLIHLGTFLEWVFGALVLGLVVGFLAGAALRGKGKNTKTA